MSFYRTRYRGSKSPSTVELEAQNNECLGEDEEEEEVLGIHRQGKAKRFGPSRRDSDDGEDDDDDDASYRMGDDEDDDEESDPEVATAKALLMQGRGPGPAAPFRWATSPFSDNSTATTALRLLSPPPVVPDAILGGQPNVHLYEPSGQVQTRPIHSDMAASLALNGAINGANAPATPAQASVFHAVKHLPGPLVGLAMEDDGKRNTWTADEDKILASLVEKYGPKKWGIVATYLPMRNAKQCHQRWHYVLKPSISRDTWTEKEDYIIYHYQRLLGNKWSHIAKYLSGRTGYAVRNRHAFLVKHYKGGKVPVPPGESLPSTAPKTNGKPIRRTNNSTMAAYARKLKKMKKQMAVGALREFKKGGATGIEQRPMETSPAPSITRREEMEMDGSGNTHFEAMSEERLSSPAKRAGGNLRVLCNHGEATGDTAPAGRTPGSAFPPSWSTSPPRSPLDLLAALPHSDLMQLPMPTPSPRTRSLFETHFPSLNSPHQAHTMPVPPPLPHVQPSLPPPSSLTIQVPPPPTPLHLRHPMEASTSPTWAAGVNMTEALGGSRFFESPQASPHPSIQPQQSSSRQGLARADDQTLSSEAHEGGKRDMDEDEMLHDGKGQEGKTGKPEEDVYEHREDAQTSYLSWHKENEKEELGPDVDGVARQKEKVPRSEALTDLKGSHGRSAEAGLEEDGREEASTSIGVEVLGDEEGENEEREYGLYGLAVAAVQEANSLEEDDKGEEKSME